VSALAEALIAAQAKALAALEKAYVRGTIDGEELTERMNEIGLTDAVDQGLLIAALDTLKEHGAGAPAQPERTADKPTAAQVAYIGKLCREREIVIPDMAGVTRAQASEIIESLQAGTYDASKWEVPF